MPQQEGAAAAEFRGAWHADGLPDAAALVFSTFELLFPDTFQRILPVHQHKVPARTPLCKNSSCRAERRAGHGVFCHATYVGRRVPPRACAVWASWSQCFLGRLSTQVRWAFKVDGML